MPQPFEIQDLSLKEVRQQSYEVAVLPFGATEPHNLHLPYGTDIFEATEIARRCCDWAAQQGARLALLPTFPFGQDRNLLAFPLAISLQQSTLNTIVHDVVQSLEHHGIPKLVILNGHGGNDFKPLLRDLHGQTSLFLSQVNWWEVAKDVEPALFERGAGDHAGELETSLGLALFPDLVHLEDADDGAPCPNRFEGVDRGWIKISRPWHLATTNSGHGDPRAATREKGERFLRVIIERIGQYLLELSQAEIDDRFPFA